MSDKIFVKTGDNEALAIDRIVKWKWGEGILTIVHEEGVIEVTNKAYVEQLYKILISRTDTLVSRPKRKL